MTAEAHVKRFPGQTEQDRYVSTNRVGGSNVERRVNSRGAVMTIRTQQMANKFVKAASLENVQENFTDFPPLVESDDDALISCNGRQMILSFVSIINYNYDR